MRDDKEYGWQGCQTNEPEVTREPEAEPRDHSELRARLLGYLITYGVLIGALGLMVLGSFCAKWTDAAVTAPWICGACALFFVHIAGICREDLTSRRVEMIIITAALSLGAVACSIFILRRYLFALISAAVTAVLTMLYPKDLHKHSLLSLGKRAIKAGACLLYSALLVGAIGWWLPASATLSNGGFWVLTLTNLLLLYPAALGVAISQSSAWAAIVYSAATTATAILTGYNTFNEINGREDNAVGYIAIFAFIMAIAIPVTTALMNKKFGDWYSRLE